MTEKAERVIRYQFVKVRLVRGAWVSLLIEKPNGKTKRVKGVLLNTPRLFIRRMDGLIEDVPVGRVVEVLQYLPPREAKRKMIRERAYQLAREIRRMERLVAKYDVHLLRKLREKGRLPD